MKKLAWFCSVCITLALALSACGPSPTAGPTETAPTQPPVTTTAPLSTSSPTPLPVGETIVVTSTEDNGPGSLRQALQQAHPGDTIRFDPAVFPLDKPATISLLSPFDLVMQGHLTIDATAAGVILDGSRVSGPFKSGIEIHSSGNIVKGLHAIHFPGAGIGISGGEDNLIEANVVGGNEVGLGLWGPTASRNRFTGNYVGILADGVTPQGNSGNGVIVMEGAHGNFIGPGNVIAFNGQNGIEIAQSISIQNTILENSIHDNAGSGIGLTEGGNENVTTPRLMDFDLQAGTADGIACPDCEVSIYSDAQDEGAHFEGSVYADKQGAFEFGKGAALSGPALTAMATDGDGNTSAFSLPARGAARSMQIQVGDTEPRVLLVTKPSDDLEDNGIGGLWSALWKGDFADAIEYEIVPLGLKRARIAYNENEYISTGGGQREIDWSRPEMSIPPDLDGYVPQLWSHDITIDFVLTFWEKENHPQGWAVKPRFKTEEEITHYLDYVRFVVSHYKGKIKYYELWNEPEMNDPLQLIEPADYIKLAKRTIPLIHEIDPQAKVVVGAVSGTANPVSRQYLFDLLNSDLMPLADAISWHPFYGNAPNVGRYPAYYAGYPALLEEIKKTAEAHGFRGEYIADELTFSGPDCTGCAAEEVSFSDIVAAKYTARVVLLHRGSDVLAGVGGVSSSRVVHYSTLRNIDNVLAGAEPEAFDVKVESSVKNVKVFTFSRSDGSLLAAIWNDGPAVDEDPGIPSTVSIPGHANWVASGIDVLNGFEQELTTEGHAGLMTISNFLLKDYPIIIRLSK